MYKIQTKIEIYIKENGARELMQKLNMGSCTIYSIKDSKDNERKFDKKNLDKLYNFFELEKDDFYYSRIKEYKGRYDPLGTLLRKRRLKLGYSIAEVAKMIKGTDRHIRRLESGRTTYDINSYYFQELMKVYKFNKMESNQILSYTLSLYNILALGKKENDVLE